MNIKTYDIVLNNGFTFHINGTYAEINKGFLMIWFDDKIISSFNIAQKDCKIFTMSYRDDDDEEIFYIYGGDLV